MKLVFILNGTRLYSLESNRRIGLCLSGLLSCGLLSCNETPKKFTLSLAVRNPKKSGFKKIEFVKCRADELYSVLLDESQITLAYNAAVWVRDNLACLCRSHFGETPASFSMWMRMEKQNCET